MGKATASAPGRAGIIGNPSDLYGGAVISCSIPYRATAQVAESRTLVLDVSGHRVAVGSAEDLAFADDTWRANVAKAVWRFLRSDAFQRAHAIDPDATFALGADTEVPLQAGCAGSTAILTAILGALLAYFDIPLSRYAIAECARRIEAEVLGVACGYQDHYMTVFGGLNYLDLRGKEQLNTDGSEPYAIVESLSADVPVLPMVLANTGVRHHSTQIHGGLRARWEAGEARVVRAYARIAELGRLGKKALVQGDWPALGEMMNENHAIQRDLNGSGEANERLIRAALDAGAWGAKLAGAGRGGTIIALHDDPAHVEQRLLQAGASLVMRPVPAPGLTVAMGDANATVSALLAGAGGRERS
jgi:galactokinase/mevalonate kinase-like predicted kinase